MSKHTFLVAMIDLKKTIRNMAGEEEIILDKKEQKIKLGINKNMNFSFFFFSIRRKWTKLFVFLMRISLRFLLVFAFQETLKIIWKAIRL